MPPSIRKARRIDGRTLALRDAGESDAAFIHALRTDPVRARFLSAVPPDPSAQTEWLRRYAADSSQAYFVIADGAAGEGTPTILGLSTASDDPSLRWLVWPSTEGKVYSIEQSSNLLGTFIILQGGILATPPENAYPVPVTADTLYLRLREH